LDIFASTSRLNVKFEINDHVHEDNDPTKKEVHATTTQDPITKKITIKVSKQILNADGTMNQTKIENAKTILHECIHAYLLTISSYPLVDMDVAETINQVLPTPNKQHDFMYDKMIPVMQRVLAEIRDKVTTQAGRTNLETLYTMRPTAMTNPSISTPWNWNDYYFNLSLDGLHNTSSFIADHPANSDAFSLYDQYVKAGRIELDR